MSSSNTVFSIPELLEMILEQGLAKDLLLQQRVNKIWQVVIQGSRSIRRKLHYDVDLLEEGDDESTDVWWGKFERVRWNPLMTFLWIGHNEMEDCCQEVDLEVVKKFDFPTASWKAMYMTSPAVRTATLYNESRTPGTLFSESGITIGKLAETQQEGSYLRIDETRTQHLALCFRVFTKVRLLG